MSKTVTTVKILASHHHRHQESRSLWRILCCRHIIHSCSKSTALATLSYPQLKPQLTMSHIATPQEVLDAIQKLDATDQDAIIAFHDKLKAMIDELLASKKEEPEPMDTEEEATDFPPLYVSGEDFKKATEHKIKAADYKNEGQLQEALEEYNLAIQAAPPSALLYANRATVLLALEQYKAAERDCNEALKENPDSAKALRVRGKALKAMGDWNKALRDLSASQTIDFDEETVQDLKEVSEKVKELEHEKVQEKLEKEAKLRKRAEEIKKAQEKAKGESSSSSARSSGGMPGGMGMPPGGMGMPPGGMGGIMEMLQSDPELAAAMQNPKVLAAFGDMMSGGAPNPAKMQQAMSDPEVGPILQKLMTKIGGAMGGGGMPGMGGMGGAGGSGDSDDIPDIDPDDDDDMPDLE